MCTCEIKYLYIIGKLYKPAFTSASIMFLVNGLLGPTDNTVLWVCHTGARANHAPVTESRGTGAVCDTDVGDCAGTAGTSRGYRGLQCRAIRGRYVVSGYWG